MEVTHNKILICLLLIKIIRNFKVIELPLKIIQLNLYLAKYVFLHNGTQLEGEKCKFQKLQNKDHPNEHQFTYMLQKLNKPTTRS